MGWFSGIKKAFKSVGSGLKSVAKSAFPSVLSLAKSVIPGGNLIGTAYDVLKGDASSSDFTKAVGKELAGVDSTPSNHSGVGSVSHRNGNTLQRKVTIYK